jgi:flagellar motility protein MotE (MotC chaperone)
LGAEIVNKKVILITAAAGLLSFLGAFGAAWFTRPASVKGASPNEPSGQVAPLAKTPPPMLTPDSTPADDGANTRAMTEEQLKELIFEVRDKITEYNTKIQNLDKEKQRLVVAQQTLQKDITELNSLRVDLAATVANLRNERDMLQKTRVEVEQGEKKNLIAIAAAYDTMDPVRAGEILSNMAMSQSQNGGVNRGASIDDAVKILFFMQERTKGKVLAELATTEPALAALLCQKLKQVKGG